MSEEDKTGFQCIHCGGEVVIDSGASNTNWKVYKCVSCESKAPLSVEDMLKASGQA